MLDRIYWHVTVISTGKSATETARPCTYSRLRYFILQRSGTISTSPFFLLTILLSVLFSGRFDIFKIQLLGDPSVILIRLEGVDQIYPVRQLRKDVTEAKTDCIE
jgi:hypothetical protein